VGGTSEIVRSPDAGILIKERSPESLAQAVRQLLSNYPDRAATRRHAEQFSWGATTSGQLQLFERVLAAAAVAGEMRAASAG
jgi:glycosyltransferase involved in cell wall biosynthesis